MYFLYLDEKHCTCFIFLWVVDYTVYRYYCHDIISFTCALVVFVICWNHVLFPSFCTVCADSNLGGFFSSYFCPIIATLFIDM